MKQGLSLLAVLLLASGCVAPQQSFNSTFNEAEFAPYEKDGNSTITGQAFLKTRGGDVKFGAGNTVTLLPATSYTKEIRERVTIGGERLGPEDSRLQKYRKTTIADGNGNFEFKDLPAGEYLLSCQITWEIPGDYGLRTTGGIAYGAVKVKADETAKVILTR